MILLAASLFVLVSLARADMEEQYDVAVVYADAKADTVFNLWEGFNHQPVRRLCYIDNDDRPQIPYADIARITFRHSERDGRMIPLSILLHDGHTKQGVLWFNDSFFGTTEDGAEWRGWITNLSSMTFLPARIDSGAPSVRPGHSRNES